MTSAEKWNRIVEYYNKYFGATEQTIQNLWENIFAEIFGYSRLDDEIERHRKVYIGSSERVITDIIIKDGTADLFIVELKQHNRPFGKGMEMQLLSYLKQLRNNTGILICNKVYIFDYDNKKCDDEQDKIEIEFKQDNPNGIKFVEMFSKNAFNKADIKEFVRKQNEFAMNVEHIVKELGTDLTIALLRDYFTGKYSEAEFEQAINRFNITITPKSEINKNLAIMPGSRSNQADEGENILTKTKAVVICNKNGISVVGNNTFSSRNKAGNTFWVNPSITYLSQDWWLLLNDHRKSELHVFKVPANSLSLNELRVRNDKPNLIDLQIRCDDNSFEDSRSKVKFESWLVKTIEYQKNL